LFLTLPFVEAGGGDQTAVHLEGLAEGARGGDRLGAGVDSGDVFDVHDVLGEEGNQTSAHRDELYGGDRSTHGEEKDKKLLPEQQLLELRNDVHNSRLMRSSHALQLFGTTNSYPYFYPR